MLASLLKLWDLCQGGQVKGPVPPVLLWVAAVAEIVVGGLLVGKYWRIGAIGAMALGWLFLLFIPVVRIFRFDPQDCGCLGAVPLGLWQHWALAAGLALAGLSLVLSTGDVVVQSRAVSNGRSPRGALGPQG